MKYLKKYKLFESNDYSELTEDIRDIVADLEDLGEISVYITTTLDDKPIIIFQHNTITEFKFSDIYEYIFRIMRYLGVEKIDKISYSKHGDGYRPISNRHILNLESEKDLDKLKSERIVNLDIILK